MVEQTKEGIIKKANKRLRNLTYAGLILLTGAANVNIYSRPEIYRPVEAEVLSYVNPYGNAEVRQRDKNYDRMSDLMKEIHKLDPKVEMARTYNGGYYSPSPKANDKVRGLIKEFNNLQIKTPKIENLIKFQDHDIWEGRQRTKIRTTVDEAKEITNHYLLPFGLPVLLGLAAYVQYRKRKELAELEENKK